MPPTSSAPTKLREFLIIAVLNPKYLASIGIIKNPTIFKVVMNTEITAKLTPDFTRIPERGYVMKPGSIEIEPTIAADM